MNPTDLAGIPLEWQVRIGFALIAIKYLAEGYSTVRAGGGLKRIIMAFWFGEQLPKVIADDYKKELSTPPFSTGGAVKTVIAFLLVSATLAIGLTLSGCLSRIHIPPGSAVSWTHSGNYGPFQDKVVATAIEKLPDGTFKVGHYDGSIGWLGFGPHDVIEGLIIDPQKADARGNIVIGAK